MERSLALMPLPRRPSESSSGGLGGLYSATVLPEAGMKRRATSPTSGARELGKMLRRGAASAVSTSAPGSDAGWSPQERSTTDDGATTPTDDGACSVSAHSVSLSQEELTVRAGEGLLPLLDSPAEPAAVLEHEATAAQQELPPEVARARQRAERARQNASTAVAQRLARQARAKERRRVTRKRSAPAFPHIPQQEQEEESVPMDGAAQGAAPAASVEVALPEVQTPSRQSSASHEGAVAGEHQHPTRLVGEHPAKAGSPR